MYAGAGKLLNMDLSFDSGVGYALSYLERGDLQLNRKQLEVIKSIYEDRYVYMLSVTAFSL